MAMSTTVITLADRRDYCSRCRIGDPLPPMVVCAACLAATEAIAREREDEPRAITDLRQRVAQAIQADRLEAYAYHCDRRAQAIAPDWRPAARAGRLDAWSRWDGRGARARNMAKRLRDGAWHGQRALAGQLPRRGA